MILPITPISLILTVDNASDQSQYFITLAIETIWDSGGHSYVQEISALGGRSTRGREVLGREWVFLGLTMVTGIPGGAFPEGSSLPCEQSLPIHPGKH